MQCWFKSTQVASKEIYEYSLIEKVQE